MSKSKTLSCIFIVFTCLCASACTKEPTPSAPLEGSASSEAAHAKQLESEECQKKWAPAAESFQSALAKSDPKEFPVWVAKLPLPTESAEKNRCPALDAIHHAIGYQLDSLDKWAASVFEYTVFLAKVQHLSDAGSAEDICAKGPLLIKRNAADFVRAAQQEQKHWAHLDCLVLDSSDLVDQPNSKRRIEYQARRERLGKVTAPALMGMRDQLIAALDREIASLKH